MTEAPISRPRALWLAALLSFSSLCYELLVVRVFSELMGDVVAFQALTIGVYLAAVGVGGFASERVREERSGLVRVEWWLVGLGGGLGFALFGLYALVKLVVYPGSVSLTDLYVHADHARVVFVAGAELITAVIGVLTGFELPLILRWARPEWSGSVLAANYAGALAGTLVFTAVLLPNVSAVATGLIVAGAVNGVALAMLSRRRAAAVLVSAGMLVAASVAGAVDGGIAKIFYYGVGTTRPGFVTTRTMSEMWGRPSIDRVRTPYQVIDRVVAGSGAPGSDVELFLNGRIQVSPRWSAVYHEALVHMPMMFFRKEPPRVLVLGGGDGVLVKELLEHRAIESVTLVELDGRMLSLAKTDPWFLEQNRGALADPRVEVVEADAVGWLRSNRRTFDAVYVDFPDPVGFDLLKLYSVEMYSMVRSAMAADAFMALDVPLFSGREERWVEWNSLVLATVRAAGFGNIVPYQGGEHTFVAARVVESDVSGELADFGIALEWLDADAMRRARRYEFPHESGGRVISMFRPPLFDFPDPVF